jgi:two-component system nitrogen regulation sensor histidine kinase GlnL
MAVRDLQEVLDALLEGLVVVDAEGRVDLLNAEASRILEISGESALGTDVAKLLGAGHPLAKLARSVLASGRAAVDSERVLERRLAGDLLVDLAASPLPGPVRGVPSGVVVALRDRTIQRSLERTLSERELLQTFGRFAAGIAHEVKNPLGGIRGAGELLEKRATDERTREAASLIVREASRIAALVDDLMIFTHGDSASFEPFNLHRVLDDVVDLVSMDALAEGVEIERNYDPSIPDLTLDPSRLTQVFLNLARNALQALEGHGRLSISSRITLEQRLTLPSGETVPTVVVTIEDDGPGIGPDLLEKIATPLFTTRAGGTGLGLAVSQHWVSRHHGTLRVESAPGEGTRVRVALPLRQPSARGDS